MGAWRSLTRHKPMAARPLEDLADGALKAALHREVIERLEDDEALFGDEPSAMLVRIESLVRDYFDQRGEAVPVEALEALAREVLDEVTGYGPLQPLLQDDDITDILINGPQQILVEREGRLARVEERFINDAHVLRVVRRMLAPLGRRLDESSPMVDARLPDGSRVNVVIPPLALDGPCVSIRKFRREALTAEDLVAGGAVTEPLMRMLRTAVAERRNILISGATGAGKTTLLNILSRDIPSHERVVTIEDAAELQLGNSHVVRLETRPPNSEGEGEVGARQLVRNALRMRPDRVILGESRGDEALDMLQAMNTGHLGSMSTVHANSARDALVRLQMMIRLAGFQGSDGLVNQIIATALDLVVHVTRDDRGHRHVVEVQRITGLAEGRIELGLLYRHSDRRLARDFGWEKRIEGAA
ncbi:CpaF family protein [Halomonas koreensis]|uniref:CpaF family protein n=1 Tax=Halomonas koreensis TaxID=245385 RepID=A0ABU1G2D9_9GAMM|nr:CpaF family protein [Halomonas koreensis]MDR5867054.1 CpaF family protein [Halomonas koreensis]